MRKNEQQSNMNGKVSGIREGCLDCPENLDCLFASEDDHDFDCDYESKPNKEHAVDPEDEGCEQGTDELLELDTAVDELVDSLFNVIEKVAEVRIYLKKLDDLTDAALDYLSAIGVPQLRQED